jgi:tetratricopeptide (TPR) repeat protein
LTGEIPAQRRPPRPPEPGTRASDGLGQTRPAAPAASAAGAGAARPAVRVIPGKSAETAQIEFQGHTKFVIQWETDAAVEMSRGNHQAALAVFDMILSAFPHYAKAWYNRAIILHQGFRDYDGALYAYDKAHAALPQNTDILHNKARLLAEMKREKEAAAVYEQVLRIDPKYVKSLEGYGALLINAGAPERAEQYLDRAATLYEKSGQDPYRALQLLATAYTNAGKTKDALRTIDKALGKHPQDDSLWEAKGIALSNMEKYREAVQAFTQALRLNRANRFAFDTRTQLLQVCRERKIRFSDGELAY